MFKHLAVWFVVAMGVVVSTSPLSARQQDEAGVQIAVTAVRGGVYMLSGAGGNIAAFVGDDGVLLVDGGFTQTVPATLDTVQALCERAGVDPTIRYVINTHWHFDHVGGNELWAETGAIIGAHENVLRLMSERQVMAALGGREVPAAPETARPRLTFNNRMNLSWNGDLLHFVHISNAHSNGDAIVHFRDANIVHAGDIYFNGMYPYIDVDNSGHIGGMVDALDEIIAHANDSMLFVPGHGPVATLENLRGYRDMLAAVRDRVGTLIDEGKSREEVVAAAPTADFDAAWSTVGGHTEPQFWTGLVYDGMMKNRPNRQENDR